MPRIGIDARSLSEKGIGAGRYLANLLKYYQDIDRKNDYILYFRDDPGTVISPAYTKKVLKLPGIKYSAPWANLRLPLELFAHKIDLLHCPYYSIPSFLPCPMVLTVHDLIFEAHPEWFPLRKALSFKYMFRRAARSARIIMADSEYTKQDIIKYYKTPENKIKVIHLAPAEAFRKLNDASQPSTIKRKYGIKDRFIIHVGAIHERRNIIRLLDGFRKVLKRTEDVQLLLIGPIARQKNEIMKIISGSNGRMLNVDHVSEEDLVCLYNAAELLVYPSLYEGFGLPLVEAMACGTPVVASNATSFPEIIGGAGILFDPYDPESITDAIIRVLADDRLKQVLSQKSIERAEQFSWEKAAKSTVDVYNKVLEEG